MESDDTERTRSVEAIAEAWVGPLRRWENRLMRSGLDPLRTATNIALLERDFDRTLGNEDIGKTFGTLMEELRRAAADKKLDSEELCAEGSEPLTERHKLICDFVERVERRHPLVVGMVLGGAGLTSRRFFEGWLRAGGYLERARTLRREARNETLRTAALALINGPYYTFVETLYHVECIWRGRRMSAERGGAQLEQVQRWSAPDWQGIVDPLASMIRNGAAHDERWRYLVAADAVEFTDRNSTRPAVRLSNRELMRRLVAMWEDSSALWVVSARISSPSFMRLMHACGFVDVLLQRRPPESIDRVLFDTTVESTRIVLDQLDWPYREDRSTRSTTVGSRRSRRAR